jgi:ABC-type transporter Mla subunit MlaD
MTYKRKEQDETAVARRSVITLRIGYIVALAAIAFICTFFFLEQRERNRLIQQVGSVSTEFAEVDHALRAIADRTERLAQTYVDHQADVDIRLDGLSLAEKREVRENLPVDPDIVSALSSLRFRFERGPMGHQASQ